MDSSYLTLDNIPLYCAAIHKFKPEFIIGFPSSLYLFAKYLRQAGIEPPRVIEQPMWTYPMQAAREMIYQGNARVLLSISED